MVLNGFSSDKDILGHTQVVHHIQFLVDDDNPGIHGINRTSKGDRLALVEDGPFVGTVNPGQDLHEGGLTSPIFTH